MDEVDGEFAPVSELDSLFETTDAEVVPSDSVQMSAKKLIVVLAEEGKVENVKEPVIPSKDEKDKEHEMIEFSNKQDSDVEVKNKGGLETEAKVGHVEEHAMLSDEEEYGVGWTTGEEYTDMETNDDEDLKSEAEDDKNFENDNEVVPEIEDEVEHGKSNVPSEDAGNKAKDDEKSVVDSKKKLTRLRKKPRKRKNKKFLSEQKVNKSGATNKLESDVKGRDEHLKESVLSEDGKQKESGTKKQMGRRMKRRREKMSAIKTENEVAGENKNIPETSTKKSKMTSKVSGMIFMCSSKTKQDCYRYKVLGLPASKRDTVLKIGAGMKLFLFDIDAKLMYGIYKAAGPGGYNIEPNAFKSGFPSQVRFTIQEDCAPVAEKDFKKIIKDNYYRNNKFNTELTLKQVKDLCKLFRHSIKSSKSTRLPRERAKAPRHVNRESKPQQRRRKAVNRIFTEPAPKWLRLSPRAETQTSLYQERARYIDWDEDRRPAPPRDYLYPVEPMRYIREVHVSPPEAYHPYQPPISLPSAESLHSAVDTDIYRRDRLIMDLYRRDRLDAGLYSLFHDQQLSDRELRPQTEFAYRDSYYTSREPLLYRDASSISTRHPEYHPRRLSKERSLSPGLRPEYLHSRYRYY